MPATAGFSVPREVRSGSGTGTQHRRQSESALGSWALLLLAGFLLGRLGGVLVLLLLALLFRERGLLLSRSRRARRWLDEDSKDQVTDIWVYAHVLERAGLTKREPGVPRTGIDDAVPDAESV